MRLLLSIILALTGGRLSAQAVDTLSLPSERLGRTIVMFTYDTSPNVPQKLVVYLTDGQKMLDNGALAQVIKLTEAGKVPPAYYVLVSTVDPETQTDHRNEYFFGNPDYLAFFEQKLMPMVEEKLPVVFEPADRNLVGISFGGLNAAYFSAHSQLFRGYGLLSPVTYPRPDILQDITFSENQNLRVFISSGKNDAEVYTRPLEQIYQANQYPIQTLYTQGGHDFDNWNAQWEDVLSFLLHQG